MRHPGRSITWCRPSLGIETLRASGFGGKEIRNCSWIPPGIRQFASRRPVQNTNSAIALLVHLRIIRGRGGEDVTPTGKPDP
jgi:hypothetical protein